jgi:precorrin-6Y C5,15-methyltransferase (decarboxylating)
VRICLTAVTLETVAQAHACLQDLGIADADIVHVSVAHACRAGSYHLMKAENPVYIFTFCLPADEVCA